MDLAQTIIEKGYEVIETMDGCNTLKSHYFNEACHSTHGAYEETLLHYIHGTKVLDRILKKGEINILEIGLGAGVGFFTTKEEILSLPVKAFVKYIAVEIDQTLIEWFIENHKGDSHADKLIESEYFGIPCFEAYADNIHLIVLLGDAKANLRLLNEKNPETFEAIYQDAFSPKRNPDLWTLEWFELLKKFANKDTHMSTYSSSISIRKAMVEAGWIIQNGPGFGPKRSSTRASLQGESDPVIIERLEQSFIESLKDENCPPPDISEYQPDHITTKN